MLSFADPPFACPASVTLNIITPPGVNNFYTNVPGRGRVLSGNAKAWRFEAGLKLNQQHPPNIQGPVYLDIQVEDAGRFDGDGILKPLIDLLVGHGVIEDDNRRILRGIRFKWSSEIKGTQVTITRV